MGSSKAILSLAKLAGYPVPGWSSLERMELPGITADRTFQIVAAAVVLHQAMTAMDVDELEVSPWALREGVLLRYIESLSWNSPSA